MKCSFNDHKKIDAIKLCSDCKIYMCNKCEKLHSGLFLNHHLFNIEQDITDIFSGFCKKENHFDKLDYFCKNHNSLCCSACIVKLKKKGRGQHSDCNVCVIEDIKNEKKEILEKNIKELENLSISIESSIKKLKESFEEMNKNREELKMKIQKIFTELRNNLNNREDELLLKIDEKFDKIHFNENRIKSLEKLPIKVVRLINSDDIKSHSLNIKFLPEEYKINELKNIINNFGDVCEYDLFSKTEIVLNNLKDYGLSGEKNNIITKIGNNGYRGTLILNELEKFKEHTWKIKLLKSYDNFHFYLGVATSDLDINKPTTNCGWYFLNIQIMFK